MIVFGFVWLGWGFSAQTTITVIQWIIFYAAFLALVAVSMITIRKAKARMGSAGRDDVWARTSKRYGIIAIVEGAGCGIVVLLALSFHRMDLLALGISLVVGAHFLPLAGLFRFPPYYVTAIAIIACDFVSLALFKADAITVAVGVATGAILWMTSIYALIRASKFIGVAPEAQ